MFITVPQSPAYYEIVTVIYRGPLPIEELLRKAVEYGLIDSGVLLDKEQVSGPRPVF